MIIYPGCTCWSHIRSYLTWSHWPCGGVTGLVLLSGCAQNRTHACWKQLKLFLGSPLGRERIIISALPQWPPTHCFTCQHNIFYPLEEYPLWEYNNTHYISTEYTRLHIMSTLIFCVTRPCTFHVMGNQMIRMCYIIILSEVGLELWKDAQVYLYCSEEIQLWDTCEFAATVLSDYTP